VPVVNSKLLVIQSGHGTVTEPEAESPQKFDNLKPAVRIMFEITQMARAP
jgi:hypothetical protein